jgi:two-component system LytT family response regulator
VTAIGTIIVDDEPLARRGIRQLLEPHPRFTVVAECRNGRDAVRAIRSLAPGLVFLDIQMPGMTGFEVVREIGVAAMPEVVFVTAYDEFAARAFETHALDYLVKPVTQARFRVAIERVLDRRRSRDAVALADRLGRLLAAREEPKPGQRPAGITVPTAAGLVVVDVSEIEWIEADDYYAAIHSRGKRLLVRESLSSFEARLDPRRFCRVHRSAIVALDQVREMQAADAGAVVVLRDGTRLPVSRRRRAAVAAAIRYRR